MVTPMADGGFLGDILQFLCDEEVIKDTGIIHKGTSTHGNCCTCQNCNHFHDDCVCQSNRIVQGIVDCFAARSGGK